MHNLSRRTLVKTILASASLPVLEGADAPFTLPKLPYAVDALEPFIDAQTMQIHHDKHHAAYVDNLNKALNAYPDLAKKPVDELLRKLDALPAAVKTAVRNQGGGHANHSLFWQTLAPASKSGAPSGRLAKAIEKQFGSQAEFEAKLQTFGLGLFGSGWVWLTATPAGEIALEPLPNQDSPLTAGRTPVFGIDVWEHAYYLKYQNRRADYLKAIPKVIHWDFVSQRFEEASR